MQLETHGLRSRRVNVRDVYVRNREPLAAWSRL